MRLARRIAVALALALGSVPIAAQEQERKPLPKDSVRVQIPGCTKGYIFTAGKRTLETPGNFEIPEGMHLRMNGPKKLIAEIKSHEGSMIELVGVMKKGQLREGVNVGGGVRIAPGPADGRLPSPTSGQILIDVEGWRPLAGACRS